MGRIIAIDYGKAKVGLAFTDIFRPIINGIDNRHKIVNEVKIAFLNLTTFFLLVNRIIKR